MTAAKQVSNQPPPVDDLPADASADLKGSLAAIKRAALRARLLAAQTGTDLIVVRAGQVVRISPQPKNSR